MNTPTIDQLVEKYIALRAAVKAKEAAHKAEVAPFKEMMAKLEQVFYDQMQEQGLKSLPTAHGTPYQSKRTSATVADWSVLLPFILDGGHTDMIERRVNKTAVEAYIEEHGDLPPGVNWREEVVVNVRGASE